VFVMLLLFISVSAMQAEIKIKKGPYLQRIGENEVTVMWLTDKPAYSWVELAPDDHTHFYVDERPRYYQTKMGRKVIGTEHTVRITGLTKGTKYRYRIYSKEVLEHKNVQVIFGDVAANDILKHSLYTFTTLDASKDTARFVVVNDIHANDSLFRDLLRNTVKERPDFVLFNGDMVTNMQNQQQILDAYLSSACDLFAADIPFFYLRGNHEGRGTFAPEFLDYFPTTTGETYFTFQQGPAFFIALDGGEDKTDRDIRYYGLSNSDEYREREAEWLKEVVKQPAFKNAPYKVVLLHMPPSPDDRAWHGIHEIKRLFVPILNESGIDLMISGHTHKLELFDQKQSSCNFPVFVNSNKTKADVSVTKDEAVVRVIDRTGKVVKTHHFKK
jgi:Predicted phosphohydrolases